MSSIPKNQISDWLKKLERESWQLELLVSAFTIFLLIQAIIAFDDYLLDISNQYNLKSNALGFLFVFLGLIYKSLQALAFCLIGHLMMRGFWIGTIGLRSVQSSIDFSQLNYNDYFTNHLKKKVISLDQLVIKLDEICSVIFAFAFLVISVLLAFGLFFLMVSFVYISLTFLVDISPDWLEPIISIPASVIIIVLQITGLIYMVDYFTLGFFKKIKWLAKIYGPFYKFYSIITLSALSRSIYYYMISKFSKRKIRFTYLGIGLLLTLSFLFDFDQYQYFPAKDNEHYLSTNVYDNLRPEGDYVRNISIASDFIDRPHFQLFIRYKPIDNEIISGHCPDFTPMKEEGINWRLKSTFKEGNLSVQPERYEDEDFEQALACLGKIFQIQINDSIYHDLKFRFYKHPDKGQKGLITNIPTAYFLNGENVLKVEKLQSDSTDTYSNYATAPFWYQNSN